MRDRTELRPIGRGTRGTNVACLRRAFAECTALLPVPVCVHLLLDEITAPLLKKRGKAPESTS